MGKLLAGWAVGLAALALTLRSWRGPWSAVASRRVAGAGRLPADGAVDRCGLRGVAGALVVVARGITSAMLSYVVVFGLTLGTMLAYAMVGAVLSPGAHRHHARRVQLCRVPVPLRPGLVDAHAEPVRDRHRRRPEEPAAQPGDTNETDPLWGAGEEIRRSRLGPDDPRAANEADQLPPCGRTGWPSTFCWAPARSGSPPVGCARRSRAFPPAYGSPELRRPRRGG